MTHSDVTDVMRIEQAAFEFPWTEQDFVNCFTDGYERMVARHLNVKAGEVLGFMIYELYNTGIHVINFAVDPGIHRQGVGSAMMRALQRKLSRKRWGEIHLELRESNLAAQLFFCKHGFRAISILKGYYPESPEDVYLMQYRHAKPAPRQEKVLL